MTKLLPKMSYELSDIPEGSFRGTKYVKIELNLLKTMHEKSVFILHTI